MRHESLWTELKCGPMEMRERGQERTRTLCRSRGNLKWRCSAEYCSVRWGWKVPSTPQTRETHIPPLPPTPPPPSPREEVAFCRSFYSNSPIQFSLGGCTVLFPVSCAYMHKSLGMKQHRPLALYLNPPCDKCVSLPTHLDLHWCW